MVSERVKATPAGEPERRLLETQSGDDTYEYIVELRERPDEDTDDADGEAVVIGRNRYDNDGYETLEPAATDAIRDYLRAQGYSVSAA